MTLFDQIERTDTAPKGQAESLFPYYNKSARPKVGVLRELAETWFLRLPDPAKAPLRSDFRSTRDTQHRAAFFELYLHELLTGAGFHAEPHPAIPGERTHPDFLLRRDGDRRFYLEATLALHSETQAAEEARMAQVYDTLNRMSSSDFFLLLRLRGAPESPPPGARLRRDVRAWLATLDADAVAAQLVREGLDALPTFEWSHAGWEVSLVPIPKSPALRGKPGVRPIGITMPEEFHIVDSHRALHAAVASKATKYGALDLPFIVAVNVIDDFAEHLDVLDALLGQECVVCTQRPDGSVETRPGRKPNGAWFGPKGPQNTRVSAVLVALNLSPWDVAVQTPTLFHNPWASRPLSPDLWPLPQRICNRETKRLEVREGVDARSFLRLPPSWREMGLKC